MKYVFMNEHIRKPRPTKPVIRVQDETLTTEANTVEISVGGVLIGYVVFDPNGLPECDSHHVKAWVEFHDKVELRPIGKTICTPREPKPVASEKKPNSKVSTK